MNSRYVSFIKRFLRIKCKPLIILFQFKARLNGKRFYCNVLSGKSNYNLSINCDMTLSCSCMDYDNSGYMGDILTHDLQEVFNGNIAKERRKKLARGVLPLSLCFICRELRLVDKDTASHYIDNYDIPKHLQVENTIRCQLSCVTCIKYKYYNVRKKEHLSLENIRKISLLMKKYKVSRLYYFKLGEPFYYGTIYDELKIIRKDNPNIVIYISTNGIGIEGDEKKSAALLCNRIFFTIDGPTEEIVQKYQKGGSFLKSYSNMKNLVSYRDSKGPKIPVIEWKYVVFNWNDTAEMILTAIELAKKAGIDIISFWPATYPKTGISWRYYLGTFFETIGCKDEQRIEVKLR